MIKRSGRIDEHWTSPSFVDTGMPMWRVWPKGSALKAVQNRGFRFPAVLPNIFTVHDFHSESS